MYTVYGKKGCPFCEKAVELLESKQESYSYIDIDKLPEAREYIRSIGATKVPQVFDDEDNHIGGYVPLYWLFYPSGDFKSDLF